MWSTSVDGLRHGSPSGSGSLGRIPHRQKGSRTRIKRRSERHPGGNGTVRRDIAKLRTFQFTTILVFHIARQLFHSFEQPVHPFKSSDSASHFYTPNTARGIRAATNAIRAVVVFAPFTGCPVCFTNY